MEIKFNMGRFDKRSRIITLVLAGIILVGFGAITYFGSGSYFPAWFLTIIFSIVLLYILSIPRNITVDTESIKIHCILELTTIPLLDLRSIRKLSHKRMKYTIPILGSYGFFGYYGYYFNLRKWEMVKVYARQWRDFVEIEDIYEDVYIVNCPDADEFIKAVRELQKPTAPEVNNK